jgi:hypothetical protein
MTDQIAQIVDAICGAMTIRSCAAGSDDCGKPALAILREG